MSDKFIKAMDAVSSLNETHGVKQKGGKQYTEVAKRVEAFRREFGGDLGIETNIILNDGNAVIIKAEIRTVDGFIVGSGLAEEIRGSSYITKTSAVEVCETSAIGRALASLGLHGGQYASANEIVGVDRKKAAIDSNEKPFTVANVDQKCEAWVQFYEDCSSQKFADNEDKFMRFLNHNKDIAEWQYNEMHEAHQKRKTELMVGK